MRESRILRNGEIYEIGRNALNFPDDISLPVKVGFYLRKNLQTLLDLAREIDDARSNILSKYGELKDSEKGQIFELRPECIADANRDVKELMNITQIVDVYILTLDDFDGINLTASQIDAILFMIVEEHGSC